MSVVHKYKLLIGRNGLILPFATQVLHVHAQDDKWVCLWVQKPGKILGALQYRVFHVVATGEEFGLLPMYYCGTAHLHAGILVLHVFEEMLAMNPAPASGAQGSAEGEAK